VRLSSTSTNPAASSENAPPGWARRADRALAQAARQTRVIAAATPRNYQSELARIAGRASAGEVVEPRFEYPPPQAELEALRPALDMLASGLDGQGALGRVYAERARELESEAAICECVGKKGIVEVARRRFASSEKELTDAAALAKRWLDDPVAAASDPHEVNQALSLSDDTADAHSLVCSLRAEVGRRSLPFRVITSPHLSALAATGDGVLIVASGRWISEQDVARTVLHEIEGHAVPAAQAIGSRVGIFGVGTARGSDDQEGRALCLEAERGHHTRSRRRELALRHVAALAVWDGASFVETTRKLLGLGADGSMATRIAARVHRGGGLARESVYLPAFLRVRRARERRPDLDRVLAAGRVSVEAADVLRGWMAERSQPPFLSAVDPTA